jgi:hypothetical protein
VTFIKEFFACLAVAFSTLVWFLVHLFANQLVARCSGKNEVVFRGNDSPDMFCQWLLSEENYGANVLCHNFKGYDCYWILQYLCKHSILPEVILVFLTVEY